MGESAQDTSTQNNPDNMAEDLQKLDNWLNKTEEKLDGGKIQRPGSIVDACQALSKARDLRAEFDKREKPLSTLKELVGDADPEIKAFSTKFERIKTVRILPFKDRGAVRDLGEWAGQCGHPDDREGDPGLGLQDEDDHGGPQGVRHGDPGRARQLTWTCALYIF